VARWRVRVRRRRALWTGYSWWFGETTGLPRVGDIAAWRSDGQAGPSGPDLGLEGRCICKRWLLGQARQRLLGMAKLAGKVGSRDGGVAARSLVMDLMPWRSPGRHVGLGWRELSSGIPRGLYGQRRRGEEAGRWPRERTSSAVGCVGCVLGGMWCYFRHCFEVPGGLRRRSA
jgi:hypothetical protein